MVAHAASTITDERDAGDAGRKKPSRSPAKSSRAGSLPAGRNSNPTLQIR
jgi:hypothetical protein